MVCTVGFFLSAVEFRLYVIKVHAVISQFPPEVAQSTVSRGRSDHFKHFISIGKYCFPISKLHKDAFFVDIFNLEFFSYICLMVTELLTFTLYSRFAVQSQSFPSTKENKV